MRKIRLFIVTFMLFASYGCQKENMGDCFKSTGKMVKEPRQISSFQFIELYDRINLFISFGAERSLLVEAGENLQEHISTEVSNNTLTIKNNNRCSWVRSFKKEMNVYLTVPDLIGISCLGSGELRFLDTLTTEKFTINMYQASGDAYLLLNVDRSELKTHTGTGTITAKGSSSYLVAFVGGNGFVDASNTQAQIGLAVATNTGYIKLSVSDELKADISGTGNIEYFGNPAIDLIDNGKGNLIQR